MPTATRSVSAAPSLGFALALLVPALLAQSPTPNVDPQLVVSRTAGLQVCDDELWGAGNGYKVRFDDRGFEFVPVLGAAAPRNYPLTYRLESIRRGDQQTTANATTPRWSDLRVEYDRGIAIERYELGSEAMEQSFRFATRPKGSGDLIVRGRLDTELTVTPSDGGLRCELPGVGGVHIGKVIGIDANGMQANGTLRWQEGVFELSLPGEFVDRAALPFVLDPLIGNAFSVATLANNFRPDVAFDQTSDNYLVVWSTQVSTTDSDLFGQRVSRSGALVGNRVIISATTATRDIDPHVCNLDSSNAFILVYERARDIHGRWITSAGAVSPATPITSGTDQESIPDVGGDTFSNQAVCTWRNQNTGRIHTAALVPDFVNRPSLTSVASHAFAAGTFPSTLRIAKGSGNARRFAITWQHSALTDETWCMVLDHNGAPITGAQILASTNALFPAVDGDGNTWVVAWQSGQFLPIEVFARTISLSPGGSLIVSPVQPITSGGANELPAVLATAGSTLIGFSRRLSSAGTVAVQFVSVDPHACLPCEGTFTVGGVNPDNIFAAGCAARSAGGPGDDALLAWLSSDLTTRDVTVRRWHSADGIVSSLGGGCGNGGLARAPCVRVPGPNFAHRLLGSTSNAPTVLVQSLGQGSSTCGSCTLVPALAGAIALFTLTDGNGDAAIASPIPNNAGLRGLVQFEQWLILRPGAACSQSGIDLSGALRVQIE